VLVAGVDSSTRACKVVVRDADTGALVRSGRAPHPDGTSVDPAAWRDALRAAAADAGGLSDVAAVSVAAQQHGMVCLDGDGAVVRDAVLWNDTRSAGAAEDLVRELGGGSAAAGAAAWAAAVGSVPVASFTVTKLRWLAEREPASMARTASVCLPHDWLTWQVTGAAAPTTDRGDASGTGYWSAAAGAYRPDLLRLACGRDLDVPAVLGPAEVAGRIGSAGRGGSAGREGSAGRDGPTAGGPSRDRAGLGLAGGTVVAAGTGDNAAAALGVGAGPGDVIVALGTSGTVFAVSTVPSADPTGTVAGFADATGVFLPLVCTLNAARVLDTTAALLGVDHARLDALARSAPAGADGLVLVPYLDGERTPNRPDATGTLYGLTHRTMTPAHLARAAVEGLLCGLADGLDALRANGVTVRRVLLVGGGARSAAVRAIAPTVFGCPVTVPSPGEYVADGAARQAAWALSGAAEPPRWSLGPVESYDADSAEYTTPSQPSATNA
jgi:xylulokinase